jgi:hypothetical protein
VNGLDSTDEAPKSARRRKSAAPEHGIMPDADFAIWSLQCQQRQDEIRASGFYDRKCACFSLDAFVRACA